MDELNSGIGPAIRDARVRRGISIEQLAHVTKISPTILRAMEAEDLDRLPGGVFTRGFFRSYAREVGLDPEETVTRFVAQFGGPAASATAAATAADLDGPVIPRRDPGGSIEPSIDADDAVSERSSDLAQMILIGIIVATVGYLGLHGKENDSVAVANTAPPAAAREVPVGTSGVVEPDQQPRATPPELRIELQAIGPCWMSASADGAPIAARLMDAGDSQAIAAHDEIRLRVGDPASVSFTVNGAAGKSLGDSGQAVSIRITPQNLAEFQVK